MKKFIYIILDKHNHKNLFSGREDNIFDVKNFIVKKLSNNTTWEIAEMDGEGKLTQRIEYCPKAEFDKIMLQLNELR